MRLGQQMNVGIEVLCFRPEKAVNGKSLPGSARLILKV